MGKKTWNPYIAGAMAGLLLVASVFVAHHFFGASTTFARSAAFIEKTLGVDTAKIAYFTDKKGKYGPNSLPDWQLMFVIGIAIGAFVSARLSNTFEIKKVPDMWKQSFGENTMIRVVVAFLGGAILIFGARMAGGCPSGHGLSGLSQLAISGFIALCFFFGGGLATAKVLYRNKRR